MLDTPSLFKYNVIFISFLHRYYFRNWHGTNDKEPAVCRGGPRSNDSEDKSSKGDQGSALLDKSSFEYLFEQVCRVLFFHTSLFMLNVCCMSDSSSS